MAWILTKYVCVGLKHNYYNVKMKEECKYKNALILEKFLLTSYKLIEFSGLWG